MLSDLLEHSDVAVMALAAIFGISPEVIVAVAREMNIVTGTIGLANTVLSTGSADRSVTVSVKNATTHTLKYDQCFMAEGHQSVPMPPTILPFEEKRGMYVQMFKLWLPVVTDVKGMFSLKVEGFEGASDLHALVMYGVCKFSPNYFGVRIRPHRVELGRKYFDGWAAAEAVHGLVFWAITDPDPDGNHKSIYASDGKLVAKGITEKTSDFFIEAVMGDAHHCQLLVEVNCNCSRCAEFAKRANERLKA